MEILAAILNKKLHDLYGGYAYLYSQQYLGALFAREDILKDGDYSLALEVGAVEDFN